MKTNNFMEINSLYIHIPFCDHICIYCDFYKMIAKEEEKEKYINYLIKELIIKKDYLKDLKTIYIGGGTPSTLNITLLKRLFETLNKYINLSKINEFTFECNPKDLNYDLISLFKKYNVNRISLGVQSLNEEKLKFLGRNHKKDDVIKDIKLLQESNINNINVDLIYGLDIDNSDLIKNDLDTLISLNVTHISCYTLIVEDKTILKSMIKTRNYKPLNDDIEADLYDFINQHLRNNGYIHYEVSNYCMKGYESKHNLTYWHNNYYLGIGANASYYYDNIRYTNINNLNKYYLGIDKNELIYSSKTKLEKSDIIYEEIMLNLRLLQGISVNTFKQKFDEDIFTLYPAINLLIDKGLLGFDNDYIYVKESKMYVLNQILNMII